MAKQLCDRESSFAIISVGDTLLKEGDNRGRISPFFPLLDAIYPKGNCNNARLPMARTKIFLGTPVGARLRYARREKFYTVFTM